MYNTLFELENKFFKLKYISDENYLDKLLHKDFTECGRSGQLFNRTDTITALLSCTEDRNIELQDFSYRTVNNSCWLVNYTTEHDGKRYYRTSVWVMDGHMQLIFHQATQLTP